MCLCRSQGPKERGANHANRQNGNRKCGRGGLREALATHRVHAFRHPRNLAGCHVAVEHTTCGCTHQVRLCNSQCLKCGLFRTLLDCSLHPNKKTPSAPAQPSVAFRASLNLANHLASRFRVCHGAVIGGLCAGVNKKIKPRICNRFGQYESEFTSGIGDSKNSNGRIAQCAE